MRPRHQGVKPKVGPTSVGALVDVYRSNPSHAWRIEGDPVIEHPTRGQVFDVLRVATGVAYLWVGAAQLKGSAPKGVSGSEAGIKNAGRRIAWICQAFFFMATGAALIINQLVHRERVGEWRRSARELGDGVTFIPAPSTLRV